MTPAHFLVGFNMYSGTVDLEVAVDPPGQDPADNLQRTGLNLSDGNVIFGYGGNDGDCATYSGWVGSVPRAAGRRATTRRCRPATDRGGVWMGGAAPEVDAAGNIWPGTGDGSSSTPYDGSDSVHGAVPGTGTRTQFFAPSNWLADNIAATATSGSIFACAAVQNGTIVQVGKSSTAFLLSQASLRRHRRAARRDPDQRQGSEVDGGDAVVGDRRVPPLRQGRDHRPADQPAR